MYCHFCDVLDMKHVLRLTWVHDKSMHLESWYRECYNLFIKQQKKHLFLIHHSHNEGYTHLTSHSPTIIFSSITQTQRVKPLSLLFFYSFKFSYPTFEMARPTPTSAHKEHQER